MTTEKDKEKQKDESTTEKPNEKQKKQKKKKKDKKRKAKAKKCCLCGCDTERLCEGYDECPCYTCIGCVYIPWGLPDTYLCGHCRDA